MCKRCYSNVKDYILENGITTVHYGWECISLNIRVGNTVLNKPIPVDEHAGDSPVEREGEADCGKLYEAVDGGIKINPNVTYKGECTGCDLDAEREALLMEKGGKAAV